MLFFWSLGWSWCCLSAGGWCAMQRPSRRWKPLAAWPLSESGQARARWRILEWLALLVGGYKIGGWVFNFQLSSYLTLHEDDGAWWTGMARRVSAFDRALDFVALPLFVYGLVALLVAQRAIDQRPVEHGDLFRRRQTAHLALKHMSLKPHRIASFLLIVGLMASVSLYPSIASKSFEDKAMRGATVQVGAELHVSINPSDLVSAEQFDQGLGGQIQAIRAVVKNRLAAFQHGEVYAVDICSRRSCRVFSSPGYGHQRRAALSAR